MKSQKDQRVRVADYLTFFVNDKNNFYEEIFRLKPTYYDNDFLIMMRDVLGFKS